MKKKIIILSVIASFIVICSFSMTINISLYDINHNDTIPYNKNLSSYGYVVNRLLIDSVFVVPNIDTVFGTDVPRVGSLVYRTVGGDSTLYVRYPTRWVKVGTSGGLQTLTKNISGDSIILSGGGEVLDNDQQQLRLSNDTLYLTNSIPAVLNFLLNSSFIDSLNKHRQLLTFNTTDDSLTISNGNSVYVPSAPVLSVNGKTGNVNLTTDSVPEGYNNLYFTPTRVRSAIFGSNGIGFNTATGTISPRISSSYGNSLSINPDGLYVTVPSDSEIINKVNIADSNKVFTTPTYIRNQDFLTAETDPIANAKTITLNSGTGISIQGNATQTVGYNPSFTINAQNTQPQWNANQLQGYPLSNAIPVNGQVLQLNGGIWVPTTQSDTSAKFTMTFASNFGNTFQNNPITGTGTIYVNTDSTKVGTLYALNDTAKSISSRLNTKLDINDTTGNWAPIGSYIYPADTVNKWLAMNDTSGRWAPAGSYIHPSDTASMLSNYKTAISNNGEAINQRVKYTDTSSMLTPYAKKGELFINVKDYGAKGDSTTDDTHAIQNAFNAVPASGAIVFFPSGKYIISSPIHVNNSCTVLGTGGFNRYQDIARPFTHLLYANSQIIDNSDSSAFIVNVDKTQWKDIGIANSNTSNFGVGIKFNNGYGVIMDGINVMGFDTCIYMMNGNHYVLTNSQIYYWKNYGLVQSDNNNTDEGSVKISNTEFYSGNVKPIAFIKILSGGGITITNCEFETTYYPSVIPDYGILVDSGFRSSIIELSNSYMEGFVKSALAFIGGYNGVPTGIIVSNNYLHSDTTNPNTKIIDVENNFQNNPAIHLGDVSIIGNRMGLDNSSGYLKYIWIKGLLNANVTSNSFYSGLAYPYNNDSAITIINTPNVLILQDSISAKSLSLNGTIADYLYAAPTGDTVVAGFDQNGNMVTFPKSSGSTTPTLQQVTTAGNSTNTGLIVNSPGSNGGILINNYMPVGLSNNSGVSFLGLNFTLSSSNIVHQLLSDQYSSAIGINSNNTPVFYSAIPGTADAIWASFFTSHPLATQSWVTSQNYLTSSGATAGTYNSVTVNSNGLVTAGTNTTYTTPTSLADSNYLKKSDLTDSLSANALDVLFPLALNSSDKTLSADTTEKDSSLVNYSQLKRYVSQNAGSGTSGVTSFNSRTGAVTPQLSDYSTFYQPLENQRLSTSNSPVFQNLTLQNYGSNSLKFYNNGSPLDSKNFTAIQDATGTLYYRAYNDAGSLYNNWLVIGRSGYTVPTVTFPSSNILISKNLVDSGTVTLANIKNNATLDSTLVVDQNGAIKQKYFFANNLANSDLTQVGGETTSRNYYLDGGSFSIQSGTAGNSTEIVRFSALSSFIGNDYSNVSMNYADSNVYINGGVITQIKEVTTDYSVQKGDYTIMVNASDTITITLPTSSVNGRHIEIKGDGVTGFKVSNVYSDSVSGNITLPLSFNAGLELRYFGSRWYILGKYE